MGAWLWFQIDRWREPAWTGRKPRSEDAGRGYPFAVVASPRQKASELRRGSAVTHRRGSMRPSPPLVEPSARGGLGLRARDSRRAAGITVVLLRPVRPQGDDLRIVRSRAPVLRTSMRR